MAAKSNSNEIRISRVYDAPVKAVWEAWTDPKQAAHWWGPRGFTITTHSKDLRTGGHWAYTMHGPDGVDYPNKAQYLEVEPLKKLVYDHGGNDDKPAMFRVTVLFSEVKGKTKMEMTMAMPSLEAAEQTREIIRKAGGNSTWDRLAEYLTKEDSGKDLFVINRSFDVGIETMYDVWTQREHFERWLPPKGFAMQFLTFDMRVGGRSTYVMKGDHGSMYGGVSYLEFERPRRLVYTQQFMDEKGNVSRHPMAPTWPETMLTTVEFTAEGPEQTRVTVTWEPYGKVSNEELDTFVKAKAGMTQGWTGSFDKLEAYLVEL